MKSTIFLVLGLLAFFPGLTETAAAAEGKPVFLYSRYFNAIGESRYLPAGNFKDVLDLLGKDFDVRVNDKPLTAENLKGVSVVLVANPSDKSVSAPPARMAPSATRVYVPVVAS